MSKLKQHLYGLFEGQSARKLVHYDLNQVHGQARVCLGIIDDICIFCKNHHDLRFRVRRVNLSELAKNFGPEPISRQNAQTAYACQLCLTMLNKFTAYYHIKHLSFSEKRNLAFIFQGSGMLPSGKQTRSVVHQIRFQGLPALHRLFAASWMPHKSSPHQKEF